MSPSEQAYTRAAVLKRVFQFTRPYRRTFYGSVFLAIFLAALAPVRPMLIELSIQKGLAPGALGSFIKGPGGFLIEITVIQIVLLALETACRFIFSFSTAALGQSVVKDLRVSTFKKIMGLNLSQFDRTPIGTLTTRTINDIESVNDIFSDGLIPIIADLLSIASILTYMFMADWQLTLVCLAPFPIIIVATYFFKESVNRSYIKVRNAVAALNAFVQEHITGMMLVQAFAAEEKEQKKFEQINQTHRSANIRAIFAYSVFFPLVELVSAMSIGLLVWWAARSTGVAGEEHAVKTGAIITSFILCLNLLFRPLRVIADKFNVLQMGMIAGERVFKVLDNPDITPASGSIGIAGSPAPKINGAIQFNGVWFAYEPGQWVLKNISFDIAPGQTLAIVGHTGSGKTSIISLLNRLYPYSKGTIRLDGNAIESYDLDFLRSRIAVVLQDVFLFGGSVLENITLRNPDITQQQVEEAARLIGIHDFILQLPGGYQYNVMERGATLSMGQRQLLSFIRALLYNPSVLILDEATSSIDTESEQLIQQAIDQLITGRTSIVIAHRLSTIRKADKILVLDRGEVVEVGTHTQLMQHNGHYARLYKMQFEPDEATAE